MHKIIAIINLKKQLGENIRKYNINQNQNKILTLVWKKY